MKKDRKISDRQKEIIINKCIELIGQGYSFKYCENKYIKYGDIFKDYFSIIERVKKLKREDLSDDFLKKTLSEIYSDHNIQDIESENVESIKSKNSRFRFILKPAIIFIIIFVVLIFSFSGVIYTSQSSIPGSKLYPIKRKFEDIKLKTYPESIMGPLHYKLLNSRIYESVVLINSGENDLVIPDLIEEIDLEFLLCKKYVYFGNKTEEGVFKIILLIKFKYNEKLEEDEELFPALINKETEESYIKRNDSEIKVDEEDFESDDENNDSTDVSQDDEPEDDSKPDDDSESEDNGEPDDGSESEDDGEPDDGSESEDDGESDGGSEPEEDSEPDDDSESEDNGESDGGSEPEED